MTRTVEMEVLEHGNTPSNVISSDGTDRNGNYSSKIQDAVCNENRKLNQRFESDSSKLQTNKMTNCMDDLSLSSPKERPSRSRSKTHSISRRSSCSSCSSSSSSSSSSGSSTSSSSRSSSSGRSRSPSYDRKYRQKRSRKSSSSYSRSRSRSYSRSYSRSRSRSYSPRQRRRYSPAYRRYYRSPPRYRSRSRSRSFRGRRYSRSRSPSHSRRFYGFARRPYSPKFRRWRSRSRTHSRSRTPLRLSEKEKLKLLEIAKKNASKALGREVELPDSLKKITEGSRAASQERVEAVQEKMEANHRSPYMLWHPVTSESKSFSKRLSPKEAYKSRAR